MGNQNYIYYNQHYIVSGLVGGSLPLKLILNSASIGLNWSRTELDKSVLSGHGLSQLRKKKIFVYG